MALARQALTAFVQVCFKEQAAMEATGSVPVSTARPRSMRVVVAVAVRKMPVAQPGRAAEAQVQRSLYRVFPRQMAQAAAAAGQDKMAH